MAESVRISSRDNRRLVEARRVRNGDAPGLIFIEGERLVAEAIRSNVEITECFVADRFNKDRIQGAMNVEGPFPVIPLADKLFDSIVDTRSSQGIVLVAKRPMVASLESFNFETARVPTAIYLHEINNPSNLGAIIRTAEAAGVVGVMLSPSSADPFSPKALRAAMGSAFRLPIAEKITVEKAIFWAKAAGVRSTATSVSGAVDHVQLDWALPRLLIFGSEAHGLDVATISLADETVTVQIDPVVESLNLAVSAGVLLFEARRQNTSRQ